MRLLSVLPASRPARGSVLPARPGAGPLPGRSFEVALLSGELCDFVGGRALDALALSGVELFKELRHLKEQGYTIVFISHKLNEIMEITDRLTIMRGGRSMGVYNTCDVTKEEISRLMVGRDVILNVQKDKAQPSDVVLRVRDVEYVNECHKKMLDKISFDVRRGEILGIAGVEGNGQKELVDMLFGFLTPNAGTVTMQSENLLGLSQQKLRDKGVALIPEDRMLYGIAGSASIEEKLAPYTVLSSGRKSGSSNRSML